MLIRTADGWRRMQHPASVIAEASSHRALMLKMSDELSALCPSLGASGALSAARAFGTTMAERFGSAA